MLSVARRSRVTTYAVAAQFEPLSRNCPVMNEFLYLSIPNFLPPSLTLHTAVKEVLYNHVLELKLK